MYITQYKWTVFDFAFYIDFTFVYLYLNCFSCMVYVRIFVTVRLISYPTFILTNLGSTVCNVCMYVCMYVCVCIY
jgi:hypothetical protein